MLDNILSFIAPHHCCGCDKVGSLLCDNCKYDIISEQKMYCIACGRPSVESWICRQCNLPYEKAWVVGERDGALQRLVGLYKFQRARSAYKVLGDLLSDVLPELPPDTVIVPIPTTPARVRERGYDHMLLVAKYIAKKRGLKCESVLTHKTNTKQRQASAKQREQQARDAFDVVEKLDPNVPYLLIDDIMTTGATLKYASKVLHDASAEHVWVAVVARQTLGRL